MPLLAAERTAKDAISRPFSSSSYHTHEHGDCEMGKNIIKELRDRFTERDLGYKWTWRNSHNKEVGELVTFSVVYEESA